MNQEKYFTIESVDYFLCDVFLNTNSLSFLRSAMLLETHF